MDFIKALNWEQLGIASTPIAFLLAYVMQLLRDRKEIQNDIRIEREYVRSLTAVQHSQSQKTLEALIRLETTIRAWHNL